MEEENDIPMLYRLIFGEAAEAGQRGCSRRLGRWAEAFEGWLEERRRVKPSSVKTARLAWGRLLRQCGKMPWEVGAEEIEGHASWMLREGYSPNTTYAAQGMILDFLRWCGERGLEGEAAGRTAAEVRRLRVRRYERARVLSQEEVEALLGLMRRDETPVGKRDYAFVLARLRLGVPLRDIQRLKWGQIAAKGAEAWVRWREGEEQMRLPEDAWQEIREALAAGGRLGGMQDEDYIFAPLAYPGVQEAGSKAGDWLAERHVSTSALLASLKLYGKVAGIDRLTLRALRSTAARMRLEQGASTEEMQAFLGSGEERRFTRYRLGKLRAVPEESDCQPANAEEAELPKRNAKPFLPGEGTTHGFYAHFQPPEAVAAVLREDIQGIEEQIVGLRRLGRGLLERQAEAKTSQEAAQLSDSYSKAASRLADMIRAERELSKQDQTRLPVDDILERLDQAAARLGYEPISEGIRADAQRSDPELADANRQLAEEMASLRYVLRNTYRLAAEAQEGREYMRLVEIYGSGCIRLVRMLRSESGEGARLEGYLRELIEEAIDEAGRRLGIGL